MEFDEGWKSGLLAEYLERVSHADSRDFAHLASLELIKIDVHRRCEASSDVRVEEYLLEHQACLDQPNDVVELLLTEFQARRRNRPDLELASYQSRFPEHYAQLCQLVAESGDSIFSPQTPSSVESTCQALASIETSQVARPERQARAESKTSLPLNFGRYKIIRELGAGAMGAVYLAHDTKLDRQVALKTPSFVGDNNEELVARFYLEARAAAKIHHRNICPIHDVGEIDGIHFISMAFVRGRSMSEYINCDKLPSEKACAALIQRLADAMTEAHRHNVIHRDLKPTNIMIDTKREPIIMDFGLARQTDSESRVTQSGMIVGTPAYMSPEQVTGESGQVTPAVDIYALGVILYELLTGKLPFQGTISQVIYKITYQDPVRPSEMRTDLDPRLESICLKMMAKRREDRHPSMEEVSSELKSYLQQKSGEAHSKASSHSLDVPQSTRKPKKPVDLKEQTETDSIHGFLAATSSQQANRTLVEASSSQFIAPEVERNDRERDHSRSDSNGKRRLFQASIIVGGLALLCGVVILFKGGKVELADGANAVVDVDSNGDVTITSVDSQVKQTAKSLSSSQNEWISLFDGNTLDGWTPVGSDGWRVDDENIVGTASRGESGWLRSNETFDDFELELEYWLGAESNSGVFIRADSNGDDSGKGLLEIQLLDDTAEKFSAINPAQHSGSLYGLIAARPTILPMPNEWHTLSVKVDGNELQVSIDSQRVLDGEIPPERQASGHIGLQLYSSQVRFRNVRLRKLEESLPGVGESGGSSTALSVKSTPGDRELPRADSLDRYFTIQNEGGGSQFAVSPDGLKIVTTGSGSPGRFTFWDLQTREPLFQFTDPNHSGMGSRDLAFSPDGTHFLYVINKYVKVLNLQTKSIESQYEFPATPIMTTLQDRNRVAAIHYEREIHQRDRARVPQRLRIWDWKTGDILFDQAMDYSRNISITPDGKYLIRSRENYHVRHTINGSDTALTLGREVKFEKTSRTRSQLTFSPDGRFAANSLKSKNGMAVLLDIATGKIVRYLEPELARSNNESHEYGASVAFTSDGSQIVTANHLGRIALWDCESGDFIREITTFAKNSSHWTPHLQSQSAFHRNESNSGVES